MRNYIKVWWKTFKQVSGNHSNPVWAIDEEFFFFDKLTDALLEKVYHSASKHPRSSICIFHPNPKVTFPIIGVYE